MKIKSKFKLLLATQISRQEFIKWAAIGAFAVDGGGALLRPGMAGNAPGSPSQVAGYGGSAYWGANQGGEQPVRRTV